MFWANIHVGFLFPFFFFLPDSGKSVTQAKSNAKATATSEDTKTIHSKTEMTGQNKIKTESTNKQFLAAKSLWTIRCCER